MAVFRLFGAVFLYSLVPLEASDLESSTIAAVRWRGGAMICRAPQGGRRYIRNDQWTEEDIVKARKGLQADSGVTLVAAHWTRR